MPQFEIMSDGTVEGTQFILDGQDLTAGNNITSVEFSAEAGFDHVSVSYMTREVYINPDTGEEQGFIFTRYRYVNESNDFVPDPKPEIRTLGTQDSHEKVGGKVLRDMSGAEKATRLILGKKEKR
jgi:hypothetical protein